LNQQFQGSKVIAICGSASGVGKSTLVERLGELISNSVTLYFDAYHETTVYPPNVYEDLVAGKEVDVREIESPLFYKDLQLLSQGKAIKDPWNRKLKPADYIILEEPFGRLRTGMNDNIDFVACIELPQDIALARRLLRNLRYDFNHLTIEGRFEYIESFLEEYLRGGRISYIKLFEAVSSDCDLFLNGLLSTDEMAHEVIKKLTEMKILIVNQ
jgi:uridine kinase